MSNANQTWQPNIALQEQVQKLRAERDEALADADALAGVFVAKVEHRMNPSEANRIALHEAECMADGALSRAVGRRKAKVVTT